MNKIFRSACVALCLSVLGFGVSTVQGAVGEKATIGGLEPSKHIYGPKLDANDLKGKVIFFEYWGINCPPCRAAMPHLQEMQKKYGSKGFTVLGNHVQGLSPKVKEYLDKEEITFPVYQFLNLPQSPCPGGIPHSVLIGANGKIVAAGYPSQLYPLVEKELAKVIDGVPILADVELKKYKSLSKVLVSNGSNIEGKIAVLREKTDDDEAAKICAAYDSWLELERTRIGNLCEMNPLRAMKDIVTLKKAVPSVNDFDERYQEFQQSPVLKKLADIQKKINALKKNKEKGRKINASTVNSLKKTLKKAENLEDECMRNAGSALMDELSGLED